MVKRKMLAQRPRVDFKQALLEMQLADKKFLIPTTQGAKPDVVEKPIKEPTRGNFGSRLSHTDKKVRDHGFKVLKKWLAKNPDLSRLEYRKLWKALYFCMWMSDKRPVQQELAVKIALLINEVPPERQSQWFEVFWETMTAGYENLDVHRLSKYAMFMRVVLSEAFKVLRVKGWQMDDVREFGRVLTQYVPLVPFVRKGTSKRRVKSRKFPGEADEETTDRPEEAESDEGEVDDSMPKGKRIVEVNVQGHSLGLFLQMTRMFWSELTPQLEERPRAPRKAILEMLEPFCVIAESCLRDTVCRHVSERVLLEAPHLLLKPIAERLLNGASRKDLWESNRDRLYETIDALEKAEMNNTAAQLEFEESDQSLLEASAKTTSACVEAVPEASTTEKVLSGKRRRKRPRSAE